MRTPGALAFGIIALAAVPAFAGSMEVSPTTVELPAGAKSAVFYVTNHGAEPIIAQVQAYDWSQGAGDERLAPSQSMVISPPMARLAPGQRQIVRLAVQPDAKTNAERSFRLMVSELPDPSLPPSQGIRVLLQFSVPVFAPTAPGQAHLNWDIARDGTTLSLTARNDGGQHAKLLAPTIETPDGRRIGTGPNALAYVLPGASHRWSIPVREVKPGEVLHLEARDDASGTSIDTDLVVPR